MNVIRSISRFAQVSRLILAGSILIAIAAITPQSVDAAPVTGFNAGRIIDDGVFTNANSMTAGQIQAFLNSKVPTCETWHAPGYGQNPPFICLKDFSENGRSAAQIIYDTAQQYQINPQVLIVLLQKEQGLVTDTWPLNSQYKTATGYGCPDTAPCDSQYFGLTNQLQWSGKMFRAILNNSPGWYTPYVLGNNYIRWSPNSSCGGSNVNIENRSTQALYNYTPYQPNQAALNAGYGTGDGCSAYGNRNFYLYFTDWFGSTYSPAFAAQPTWQQIYTDASKSTALGWNASLKAGQSAYAVVIMKNIGNTTWTKSGAFSTTDTRLATHSSWGRSSAFCDGSWVINCTRPAALKEASVAPGASGTFEFAIRAPNSPGNYAESFSPIVDGRTVFSAGVTTFNINVTPATFSAQPAWQQIYADSSKSVSLGWNANLMAGQSAYAVVAMKNTGNTTWTKSGAFTLTDTRLATYGPWGRSSAFCDGSWVINCTRPAGLKEDSVAPGATGTFEFAIRAPNSPGNYMESFSPIVDGRTVFGAGVMTFNLIVSPASFTAQPTWQQIYTDSSKSTALGWNANLTAGQSAYAVVVMKNTGNTTWTQSGAFASTDTRLATYGPWGRNSAFCDNSWIINCTRPAALKEASVPPGASGTFEFAIRAPSSPGNYAESFSPVVDGRTVFTNGVMTFNITTL